MRENLLIMMISIAVISFAINLPLGYLREGAKKFSPLWFLYIHLSIPLIAYLRIRNGIKVAAIPIFIVAAIMGQFSGGRLRDKEGG